MNHLMVATGFPWRLWQLMDTSLSTDTVTFDPDMSSIELNSICGRVGATVVTFHIKKEKKKEKKN